MQVSHIQPLDVGLPWCHQTTAEVPDFVIHELRIICTCKHCNQFYVRNTDFESQLSKMLSLPLLPTVPISLAKLYSKKIVFNIF